MELEVYFESLDKLVGSLRAVNRTVYGYGRTPYGKYTAPGRTVS